MFNRIVLQSSAFDFSHMRHLAENFQLDQESKLMHLIMSEYNRIVLQSSAFDFSHMCHLAENFQLDHKSKLI
jgi:hypothetical protein